MKNVFFFPAGNRCLHPPMNGEAFALSASLFLKMRWFCDRFLAEISAKMTDLKKPPLPSPGHTCHIVRECVSVYSPRVTDSGLLSLMCNPVA